MNANRARTDRHPEAAIARCRMSIRRTIAIVFFASGLAGCGVVDLISKGMSYSNAVAADLERDIGVKPECAGRPARSRWCKSITLKE
jgi:hypothetical protein